MQNILIDWLIIILDFRSSFPIHVSPLSLFTFPKASFFSHWQDQKSLLSESITQDFGNNDTIGTRCYWRGNHKCAFFFFFVILLQGESHSRCNLVQNHPFQCKISISRKELSSETFFHLLSPISTIEVDVIFINLIFEYETEAEDLSHPGVSELLTRIVIPNWHFLCSSRLNAQILTASRGSQAWMASRPEFDFQIFRFDFSRVSKHM